MNPHLVKLQGDQLSIAVSFWHLVKSDMTCVHVYRSVHLEKSNFKRYKKNTAMFNWSPCMSSGVALSSNYFHFLYFSVGKLRGGTMSSLPGWKGRVVQTQRTQERRITGKLG